MIVTPVVGGGGGGVAILGVTTGLVRGEEENEEGEGPETEPREEPAWTQEEDENEEGVEFEDGEELVVGGGIERDFVVAIVVVGGGFESEREFEFGRVGRGGGSECWLVGGREDTFGVKGSSVELEVWFRPPVGTVGFLEGNGGGSFLFASESVSELEGSREAEGVGL